MQPNRWVIHQRAATLNVKPPIPEGMSFQPSGRSPGLSQVKPVTTSPGLATVPSWFSSDAL